MSSNKAYEMSAEEALREAEESVDQLAIRAYELHNRKFTPLYPWVFVRVLPKEQVQNGIILPGTEQNKTIHEGIVLAIWQKTEKVDHECEVKVGEHVLFPHFAGMPIAGYSDKHYRVIRSEDWAENQQGGTFGLVEYDNDKPSKVLLELIRDNALLSTYSHLAELIEQRFLLVDREATSVTLSGR